MNACCYLHKTLKITGNERERCAVVANYRHS